MHKSRIKKQGKLFVYWVLFTQRKALSLWKLKQPCCIKEPHCALGCSPSRHKMAAWWGCSAQTTIRERLACMTAGLHQRQGQKHRGGGFVLAFFFLSFFKFCICDFIWKGHFMLCYIFWTGTSCAPWAAQVSFWSERLRLWWWELNLERLVYTCTIISSQASQPLENCYSHFSL